MRHFFAGMNTEHIYNLFKESTGVVTDSRLVKNGQIFFALWGDKYDGNKYAEEAIGKGASWAVIDNPDYESEKTILVEDSLRELQLLAAYHRIQLKIPVLAITGTNGKTTTKELIAAVLSEKYKIHYTKGNLNNHIGVPLTILSATPETEFMIIEMGANHPGEIDLLCNIAAPDYGIITNIGTAHIEGFGSFEGVVSTKTELFRYLQKVNGIALYNDQDSLITDMIFRYVNRAVPFSDPDGTLLLIDQEESEPDQVLSVTFKDKNYRIKSNLFGRYNYWNIKAAVATGLFFGVAIESIADAIENYIPANNRSQLKKTSYNTLICDSYNANPSSMINALQSFVALRAKEKLVILGDMLELGDISEDEHRKIIKFLEESEIRDAFLVGPVFSRVYKGNLFRVFNDTSSVIEYLKENSVHGYTVLIKGSRGIGLEKTYDYL